MPRVSKMQDRWDENGGRQEEEERIEREVDRCLKEERIEREVDWCLKEEFRRLGLQQPASDGPVGSEARWGRRPGGNNPREAQGAAILGGEGQVAERSRSPGGG